MPGIVSVDAIEMSEGHAQAEVGEGPHDTERHDPVRGIKGGRAVRAVDDLPRHRIRDVLAELAGTDMPRLRGEAPLLHRLQEALEPSPRRREVQGPGDRRDAPVTEIEEVVGDLASGRDVVDRHRIGTVVVDDPPEQHGRYRIAVEVALLVPQLRADGDEEHAVAGQHPDARQDAALVLRLLVAVEHHEGVAPGGHRRFRGADDAGEERVGEVGNDERDQLAAAPLEVSGCRHRCIVEIADRRQHAGAQLRADERGVVDDGRHRRRRHAGRFRHILDRRQ